MNEDKSLPKKMRKESLLLATLFLSFIVVSVLFTIPDIGILEWKVADVWARQDYPRNISDKVAVIGIDDDFFEVMPFSWPLEKGVYADLVFFLEAMGAKVIAFDIEFSHEQNQCDTTTDYFHDLVSISPNLVFGYGFLVQPDRTKDSVITQFGSLRSNTLLNQINEKFSIGKGRIPLNGNSVLGAKVPYKGLRDLMSDCGFYNRSIQVSDGVDRWMPLMLEQDSLIFASLALSSVQQYLGDTARFYPEENVVVLDTFEWHVSDLTDMAVNFTDSIPYFTMSDIFLSFQDFMHGAEPEINENMLKNRIVFIGYAGHADGDLGINPVSIKNDAKMNNEKTPMVLLHAYSANTMLNDNDIRYLGRHGSLLLSIVLLVVVYFMFRAISQGTLYTILPVLFIGIYLLGYALYRNYIFLPIVEALSTSVVFTIAGVFINYYENNFEYRYISSMFRTYISPELIDKMVETHTVPKLGGEEIQGTAFFTDIEKFSTFSEMFTPEELIHVLNEYFTEMTDILKENQGTLDKFIGDAIVAIFGAPYFYEDNATYACNAAWRMQKALELLREKWKKNPELRGRVDNMKMRIGINSGPFIVGHLGSSDRMSYTMIGDTVNLAARLESGAKQYGVYTMVGESTYNFAKKDFLFRCVDRIVVVGRSKPVSVYELLAPVGEVSAEITQCYEKYNIALDLYFEGEFEQALEAFRDSQKCELSDKPLTPSSVMADRCEILIKNPPKSWDGVYTMQSK